MSAKSHWILAAVVILGLQVGIWIGDHPSPWASFFLSAVVGGIAVCAVRGIVERERADARRQVVRDMLGTANRRWSA